MPSCKGVSDARYVQNDKVKGTFPNVCSVVCGAGACVDLPWSFCLVSSCNNAMLNFTHLLSDQSRAVSGKETILGLARAMLGRQKGILTFYMVVHFL